MNKINRQILLFCATPLLLMPLASLRADAPRAGKLNIVFILTDDK